jgi:1-aminocyclopropane-1-carboxylate deaminase/D-cysteine desulfhydrase-like pyridoxal-dependent ACC family enzyme
MLPALSFESITVDTISSFAEKEIEVDILRLDKISSFVSGNKWFKLRYYLDEVKAKGKKGIVTFGGAWSNHILATAAICELNGLKSIGIIRGEEPKHLSFTMVKAKEMGMQLYFISRTAYQNKEVPPLSQSDEYYIVNEGGYGEEGTKGASTILDYCTKSYSHYCCAVGTGTMMAGIINAISPDQQVIGISTMKNNTALPAMIQTLVKNVGINWQLFEDYHFGGYAKYQLPLLKFMNDFYRETNIPSDFVYTGKLFFAISDLIGKNYFPPHSRLLLIHSGGLQGNISLPNGALIF